MKKQAIALSFLLAFLALVVTVTVTAASDTVVLSVYQIDYLDRVKDGDLTTWYYAVTTPPFSTQGEADPDETTCPPGLSHWVIAIGQCYTITAPADGVTVAMPTSGPQCSGYDCIPGVYETDLGRDPTTNIQGVKWDNLTGQLEESNPGTHVFSFTVQGDDPRIGVAPVAIKAGWVKRWGYLVGPVCPPNATTARNLAASNPQRDWVEYTAIRLLIFIVLALFGSLLGSYLWRRRYH